MSKLTPDDPRHGTVNGYVNLKCRCDQCREASTRESLSNKAKRKERLAADPSLAPHGSYSTYTNWGCRCDLCKGANASRNRRARAADTGERITLDELKERLGFNPAEVEAAANELRAELAAGRVSRWSLEEVCVMFGVDPELVRGGSR